MPQVTFKTQGRQHNFSGMTWKDGPAHLVPPNGIRYLENLLNRGDRIDTRGGSKLWSDESLPSAPGRTGYSTTSTVSGSERTITATVGTFLTADETLGWFFVHDDGAREPITEFVSNTVIKTYTEDSAAKTSTAGYLTGKVNCFYHHETQNKFVLHIDRRIFVSDATTLSWEQVVFIGAKDTPEDAWSNGDAFADKFILFNSNGMYSLDLLVLNPTYYYRINSAAPSSQMTTSGDEDYDIYGRRRTYTMARLTGDGVRDSYTSGVVREHEGPPCLSSIDANDGNYVDFASSWKATAWASATSEVIAGLTMPKATEDPGYLQQQWTHYRIYSTLTLGKYGVDPLIPGNSNSSVIMVNNSDVPVAKVMRGGRAGTTLTLVDGLYQELDVGSGITMMDTFGTLKTTTIASFTSNTVAEVADSDTDASSYIGIGGGSLLSCTISTTGSETIGAATLARQAGYSFVAGDVGKTLFLADGTKVTIVRYRTASSVEIAESLRRVMRSSDGVTWYMSSPTTQVVWEDIAFGGDVFVALGSGDSTIYTSKDGKVWAATYVTTGINLTGITYGNGRFVAIGPDGNAYSDDGYTWVSIIFAYGSASYSIAYGNSLYVAVEAGGMNRVLVTASGTGWTAYSPAENNTWEDIAYGAGVFTAVSSDGTNRVMTSNDGNGWTAVSVTANPWWAITFAGGLFVATNSAPLPQIMTSADGATWGNINTGVAGEKYKNIAYGDGTFVIAPFDGGYSLTSEDGITWTRNYIGVDNPWDLIAYGNGTFVTATKALSMTTGAMIDPTGRSFTDEVIDASMRAKIKIDLLEHRLSEPIPNGQLGEVVPGFVFSGAIGSPNLNYGEVTEGYSYLMGSHNPLYQIERLKAPLTNIAQCAEHLTLWCRGATYNVPIKSFNSKDLPQAGITVAIIRALNIIDLTIGSANAGGTDAKRCRQQYVITDEPALRVYDSLRYGDNMAEDRFMDIMRVLVREYSVGFHQDIGFIWYGSDDADVPVPNRCFRHGSTRRQGFGLSECSGSAYPFPEFRIGPINVKDDENFEHVLVMNWKDGKVYDIATFDGPSGSDKTMVWKDGVAVAGTGGTNYVGTVTFRADHAPEEHMIIECGKQYFYFAPWRETLRDASGYDSNGYPDSLTFDMSFFQDGERLTADATASDITLPKQFIRIDRQVRGNEILTTLAGDRAPWSLTGRSQMYVGRDVPDAPSELITTEDDNQAEFSSPTFWFGRFRLGTINRSTGATVDVGTATAVTGPEGNSETALQITEALSLGSVSVSAGSILIWATGTIAVTIGGTPVVLAAHGTSGTWTLYYADTQTLSGALIVTPTGTAKMFGARGFDADISTASRTYYYSDIVNNSGKVMEPYS